MAINYVVRVSDGENEIYYQRKKLYDMGLRFNKRAGRGDSFTKRSVKRMKHTPSRSLQNSMG